MTVETAPAPFYFDAPLVNPSPNGLYGATDWADEGEPHRWLTAGVQIRPHNYGGETGFGVWTGTWCAPPIDPDEKKDGERPDMDPPPFDPIVVWAADKCDLTRGSQTEVVTRAQQNLRLQEQNAVEMDLAVRALADAGAPTAVADITAAVSKLEELLADTNTVGQIHAAAGWAAYAAQAQLIFRSGSTLKTPLGHTWVFGGGYKAGLGAKLVATSPTYGWRGEAKTRTAIRQEWNRFVAIAERPVAVGYEKAVGAVTITP
jgi:hypothetical protein